MNNFIYSEYLSFGHVSGIGLCTLWSPKHLYRPQKPFVQVIGNLYSNFGIGILIRNVLANPSISNLVITGVDHKVMSRRQADNLLNGDLVPEDLFLAEAHIEEFYKRISLHDARHFNIREQEKLSSYLLSIPESRLQFDPINISLPEISTSTFPTNFSGHIIRADNIKESHTYLLKEVRTFGQLYDPPLLRQYKQILWQATIVISREASWKDVPFYSNSEIQAYGEEIWQESQVESTSYSYGNIMRKMDGDQISNIIEKWNKYPDSMVSIINLWRSDYLWAKSVPCLTTIHLYRRNDFLEMFVYFRSNEVYDAWPKNIGGLRYFQERIANEANIKIGGITITCGCALLLDHNIFKADLYLEKIKEDFHLKLDEKGDWNFRKSNGKYFAEHYKNGKIIQVIQGNTITELERKVTPYISLISHAIYVGKQLKNLENITEK